MGNLFIQESWVDRSRDVRCGESDVYETFTDNRGELFRSLQKEYGRCVSKVYIDLEDGKAQAIGWVFQKIVQYEDTGEDFLMDTWVTVHSEPPERTVKYNYA